MEALLITSSPETPPPLYVPARHQRWCPRGSLVSYQSLLVEFSEACPIYKLQIHIGNVVVTGYTNIGGGIRIDHNNISEHRRIGKFKQHQYVPARHQRWCPRGSLVSYQSLLVGFSEACPIYKLKIHIGNVVVTGYTNTGGGDKDRS